MTFLWIVKRGRLCYISDICIVFRKMWLPFQSDSAIQLNEQPFLGEKDTDILYNSFQVL